jgi:tetratricopeptide (TPR) repeat protein
MYDLETSCTSTDLINCLRFYFYIGDNEKYDEILEKVKNMHYEDGEDLIVKGWKCCYSPDPNITKSGQVHFQTYVEKFGSSNIDTLMGGFKCLERLKENEDILDAFGEIGSLFQTFFPLHIEKCKIFLNTNDFDNAIDYINTKVNIKHFEIYKVLAVCNLLNEGDFQKAYTNIEKLVDTIFQQEPRNPELYYTNAQMFARICERRPNIIKKCEQLIDRALEYAPRNAKYLIEKGYYRLFSGEVEKAFSLFTQSGEIDVNNKESSIGIITCKLLKGKLKEAQEDIEFLKEIFYQGPKIIFFDAVIKYKMGEKEENIGAIISEALNIHVKLARQQSINRYDQLIATEFDFLYDMAKGIF